MDSPGSERGMDSPGSERGMDSPGSEQGPVKGLSEHENAPADSTNCRKYLGYLGKYQVLMSDSAAR